MSISRQIVLPIALWPILAFTAQAETATDTWQDIRPMLEQKCYECHGEKKIKGGVDLKKLDGDPKLSQEFDTWEKVKEVILSGDMPPDDKAPLPDGEKAKTLQWLNHWLDQTLKANAGDPGTVTIRRLTNDEYDHTIRDLTGLDLHLSSQFSPDGGGGEGFSNVGDVLFVSPQQLEKYFAAARKLVDQATIMPGSGITFQPQRVGLRGPVQVKAQAEQALYVWYQKMAEPILPNDTDDQREADYVIACWKWQHKDLTGAISLEQIARDDKLTLPFLQNWWNLFSKSEPKSRYLDLTRVGFHNLPPPDAAHPHDIPQAVRDQALAIQAERRSWLGPFGKPGTGTQRHQQDSDGIRPYPVIADVKGKPVVHIVLGTVADGNTGDWVTFSNLTLTHGKKKELYIDWLKSRLQADKDALTKPDADTAKLNARIAEADTVVAKFGKDARGGAAQPQDIVAQAPMIITLPLPEDAIKIQGEGKLDIDGPDADAASVQWLATTGTPPDPNGVLPGALTVWKRGTSAQRTLGHEFNVMQSAFPDEYLRRLEEVSRNYLSGGHNMGVYYLSDEQLLSIISPAEKAKWEKMMEDWKYVRNPQPNAKAGKEWDDLLKQDLAKFAERAWRRPLASEETAQIGKIYDDARSRDLDRESAGREVLVHTLVSPNFLFKLEDASQPGEHKLTAWELATRLSYFLWASTPDAQLRAAAADGSLLQPTVLERESKRMLRDPRAAAMAEEFAGQWLKFNSFDEKANIDTNKFPEFTVDLKRDMYRESLEFFSHIIREDRPVKEIISADYTYLNERLAKFYGIPNVIGDNFRQVPVAQYQRGGVLGMGCVLAKTSYPQRTSPVLRGNWLLTSILGTPTPPPPNNVPKLDDSVSKASTLRERLERHRKDQACAVCHQRIDPLGFALEGFDPIGRIRATDEAGLNIDNSGEWKDGTKFQGLDGLRNFLIAHDKEFTTNFCRKLLGYALGRSLILTDRPLIDSIRTDLGKSDDRFSVAVLDIVKSRQFQNRKND